MGRNKERQIKLRVRWNKERQMKLRVGMGKNKERQMKLRVRNKEKLISPRAV